MVPTVPGVDGILNINKPPGRTSFDVVARVRSLTGCRRVGHAGTLDPDATGVLLVCLGQATRMTGALSETVKAYRAEVRLGIATDTYDASGRVTSSVDPSSITPGRVEQTLTLFRGRIQQTPPVYSALKVRGRRMYEIARSGVKMTPASRRVELFRLELVAWMPPVLTLEVECGKGTYIRSLAHDLGQVLGCGAHLRKLERTRCGPFCIADSVTMPEFEVAVEAGYWERFLYPMDSTILHWTAAVLGEQEVRLVRAGRPVSLVWEGRTEGPSPTGSLPLAGTRCRAYTIDGTLIAILEFDSDDRNWHPRRVFCGSACSSPEVTGAEALDAQDNRCGF